MEKLFNEIEGRVWKPGSCGQIPSVSQPTVKPKSAKIDGGARRGVRKRCIARIAEPELVDRGGTERFGIANGEKLRLPVRRATKVAERPARKRIHKREAVDEVVERQHAQPAELASR